MFSRPDCRPQGTVDFGGAGHQRASLAHSFANGQYWIVNEAKTQVLYYDQTMDQQEEVYTVMSDPSEEEDDSGSIEYMIPFTFERQGSESRPHNALWVATTYGSIAIITIENRMVVGECFIGRPVVAVCAVDEGKVAIKRPSNSWSCGDLLIACRGEMKDTDSRKEMNSMTNRNRDHTGSKEYHFEIVCVSFIASCGISQEQNKGAFNATAICDIVCGVVGSIVPLTVSGLCEELYIIANSNHRQRDTITLWRHNVGLRSTVSIGTYTTPVDSVVSLHRPMRSLLSSMSKKLPMGNEATSSSSAICDHSGRRSAIWISHGTNVHLFVIGTEDSADSMSSLTLTSMHQCPISNIFPTALGNVIWTVDEGSKAVVWDTANAQPLGSLCLRSCAISSSGSIQKTNKGSLVSSLTGVDEDGSAFSLSIEEALNMHSVSTPSGQCGEGPGKVSGKSPDYNSGNTDLTLSMCRDFIKHLCMLLKQSGKSPKSDNDALEAYKVPASLVKFLESGHRTHKNKGSSSSDRNTENNKRVTSEGGDDDFYDNFGVMFLPEAIHTLVDCKAVLVDAFNKLNWVSSSFQDDIQQLISYTTHYRRSGVRAKELVEKISRLCPMFPVPEDVTDPFDSLLFAAECCVEVLQEKIDSENRGLQEVKEASRKENRDSGSLNHSNAVNGYLNKNARGETEYSVDQNQAVHLLEIQIKQLKEEVKRLTSQNINSHNEHNETVRSYKEDIMALNKRIDNSSSKYEMQVEGLKRQLLTVTQTLDESKSIRNQSISKSVTPERNTENEMRIARLAETVAEQATKRKEELMHRNNEKEQNDIIITSLKNEIITKNELIKELILQIRSVDGKIKENNTQVSAAMDHRLKGEITHLEKRLHEAAKTEDRLQSRVSHLQVKLQEGRHLSKELRDWVMAQQSIPLPVADVVEKRLLFMLEHTLRDIGGDEQHNSGKAHHLSSSHHDLVHTPLAADTHRGVFTGISSINTSCRMSGRDSSSAHKGIHSIGMSSTASPPTTQISTPHHQLAATLNSNHYHHPGDITYNYDTSTGGYNNTQFAANTSSSSRGYINVTRASSNDRIAEAVIESLQGRNGNTTTYVANAIALSRTPHQPQLVSHLF